MQTNSIACCVDNSFPIMAHSILCRVSPALCCLRLPGRVRLPLPRVLVSWRNFLMVALRSEAGVEVRWGRGWCRLCRLKLLLLVLPIFQ